MIKYLEEKMFLVMEILQNMSCDVELNTCNCEQKENQDTESSKDDE